MGAHRPEPARPGRPARPPAPPGGAATIISIKALLRGPDGRCLLLRRSARNHYNVGKWDLPGGKLEQGESLAQALAREVREETGLRVAVGPIVGAAESRRGSDRVLYLFISARCRGRLRLSLEHDAYCWVRVEELGAMDLARQFLAFAARLSAGGT